jgi:uncharacterized membrane protein YidH (DUF202 family)
MLELRVHTYASVLHTSLAVTARYTRRLYHKQQQLHSLSMCICSLIHAAHAVCVHNRAKQPKQRLSRGAKKQQQQQQQQLTVILTIMMMMVLLVMVAVTRLQREGLREAVLLLVLLLLSFPEAAKAELLLLVLLLRSELLLQVSASDIQLAMNAWCTAVQ